jgi:two-component system, cell cycle sensor histidine kinase and response regulator CckA
MPANNHDSHQSVDRSQEDKFRTSEADYRYLVENSPNIIYILTPEGIFNYLSPNWTRLLGHSVTEAVGRPFQSFVHVDDVPACLAFLRRVLELHADAEGVEYRVRHTDGSWRWLHSIGRPLRDAAGEVTGLQGSARDITERKRAEEELKASEEKLKASEANYRAFFESMQDMVVVGTAEGRVIYANEATKTKLGYSLEDLDAIGILGMHPADRRTEAEEIFAAMFRGERDYCPLPVQRKDGALVPVETRVSFGKWSGEDCVFGIVKDLSVEQEAQQRFERLFRYNPTLMALSILPERSLVDVNDAWLKTLGYERAEVIGKTAAELGLFVDTRQQELVADLLAAEDRVVEVELQVRRKDGGLLDGLFSGELVVSQDKRYFLTVMIDITARKRAEEEREKLQVQLVQAQKMESVGRLAGGVAHDFNNMLQVILSNTEQALDDLPPESPVREILEDVEECAERSAGLTRQLLAFARKQVVMPKAIDLNETVGNALNMLRRLIGEHIALFWRPGRNLGSVYMDPTQVDQVLANLFVNARDAISGTGTITIETDNTDLDEVYCAHRAGFAPGKYVLLAVSDDGCGMDAEMLSHVFEPFFTTKEQGKGTGLGMATVYGIVKQNDGFIDVCSEPDAGTTIKIYLPRHEELGEHRSEETAPAATRSDETILIVEDEPVVLKMTASMLKRLGYTAIAARTPGEALRLAREHGGRIDLLLTDVVMPEMNGRDLAQKLLSIYPHITPMFMSGYTAAVIFQSGVLEEGMHFLQKPFTKNEMSAKLREVLAKSE